VDAHLLVYNFRVSSSLSATVGSAVAQAVIEAKYGVLGGNPARIFYAAAFHNNVTGLTGKFLKGGSVKISTKSGGVRNEKDWLEGNLPPDDGITLYPSLYSDFLIPVPVFDVDETVWIVITVTASVGANVGCTADTDSGWYCGGSAMAHVDPIAMVTPQHENASSFNLVLPEDMPEYLSIDDLLAVEPPLPDSMIASAEAAEELFRFAYLPEPGSELLGAGVLMAIASLARSRRGR